MRRHIEKRRLRKVFCDFFWDKEFKKRDLKYDSCKLSAWVYLEDDFEIYLVSFDYETEEFEGFIKRKLWFSPDEYETEYVFREVIGKLKGKEK